MAQQDDGGLLKMLLGQTKSGGSGGLDSMMSSPMLQMGIGLLGASHDERNNPYAALLPALQAAQEQQKASEYEKALQALSAQQVTPPQAQGQTPAPAPAGPQMSPASGGQPSLDALLGAGGSAPQGAPQMSPAGAGAPAAGGAGANPFQQPQTGGEPSLQGASAGVSGGNPQAEDPRAGFESLMQSMLQSGNPRIQEMALKAITERRQNAAGSADEAVIQRQFDPRVKERVVGTLVKDQASGNYQVAIESIDPNTGKVQVRNQDTGIQIINDKPWLEKQLDTAGTKAAEASGTAKRMAGLAHDYDAYAQSPDAQAGIRASMSEWLKGVTGNEDAVTQMRKEYSRLVIGDVVNNLPPGVASDKDVQLVMDGFISDTANPETVASFLRGMAKIQIVEATRAGHKARFLGQYQTNNGWIDAWEREGDALIGQRQQQVFGAAQQARSGAQTGGQPTTPRATKRFNPATGQLEDI